MKSHRTKLRFAPRTFGGCSPMQMARAYNFPDGTDGSGQTIGIISLGGGINQTYVNNLFISYGLTPPPIKLILVDGAQNAPDGPNGADGENYLDIAMVGGSAPKAKINFYLGPNSQNGFVDCFVQAFKDNVDVVSCSWGMPEDQTGVSMMTQMDNIFGEMVAKGINTTVASGDSGSGDGEPGLNVDSPSSSPHVVACGGTRLITGPDGVSIVNETVWNDGQSGGASGGGFSKYFPVPDYQKGITNNPWRGLPDISGNADPQTGYQVLVDNVTNVIGGTSAVAPLFAGLIARLNQAMGKRIGFLNPILYSAKGSVCRDVVSGNDGAYPATPGWDAASGWGSPDGTKILKYIQNISNPPPPVVISPTPPVSKMTITLVLPTALSAGTYTYTVS